MSKPNKLIRGRSRKKATQPTTNLNDDADDFSRVRNLRVVMRIKNLSSD